MHPSVRIILYNDISDYIANHCSMKDMLISSEFMAQGQMYKLHNEGQIQGT